MQSMIPAQPQPSSNLLDKYAENEIGKMLTAFISGTHMCGSCERAYQAIWCSRCSCGDLNCKPYPMGFSPVPSRLLKADQVVIYQERLRLSCTLNNMAVINHNYGL